MESSRGVISDGTRGFSIQPFLEKKINFLNISQVPGRSFGQKRAFCVVARKNFKKLIEFHSF
jgi:hypothetical protein